VLLLEREMSHGVNKKRSRGLRRSNLLF